MVAGAVVELRQRQLGAEILLGDEDLVVGQGVDQLAVGFGREGAAGEPDGVGVVVERDVLELQHGCMCRSEEHTSELQSLMRISYAVFCLNTKKEENTSHTKSLQKKQTIAHCDHNKAMNTTHY